jgi:hypothetical protein
MTGRAFQKSGGNAVGVREDWVGEGRVGEGCVAVLAGEGESMIRDGVLTAGEGGGVAQDARIRAGKSSQHRTRFILCACMRDLVEGMINAN